MGFISRLFGKVDGGAGYAARLKQAKSLHGAPIRYVTERAPEMREKVVSHGGHLALVDNDFIIDSEKDTLFRCPVAALDISFLLSGDGVILSGPNALKYGEKHEYIVYFVYYRK